MCDEIMTPSMSSLNAEEIVAGCLACFERCSPNEAQEVKISDICEAVARKFSAENSEECLQESIVKLKEDLTSILFPSQHISKETFTHMVRSYVGGDSHPSMEEHFTHEPSSLRDTEDQQFANNNLVPLTPRVVERCKKALLDSVEDNLAMKTREVERLEEELKRVLNVKEALAKKVAELEEDIENRDKILDDNKRIESINGSLRKKMISLERDLNKFKEREEKLVMDVHAVKLENERLTEQLSIVPDLKKELLKLENQLESVTEERGEAARLLEAAQRELAQKELQLAENSQYIDQMRIRFNEMKLLQEDNESFPLGFLQSELNLSYESTGEPNTLLLEIGNSWSFVDASTMTDIESPGFSTAPSSQSTDRPQSLVLRRLLSVEKIPPRSPRAFPRRVLTYAGKTVKSLGILIVSVVLVFLILYLLANLFATVMHLSGNCQFDRHPCWVTIFGKRLFYFTLKRPPPV